MSFLRTITRSTIQTLGVLAFSLALLPPVASFGAPAKPVAEETPKLNEETINLIQEIPKILETKDYTKALSQIDAHLAKVEAGTYDAAVTNLFGAQVCFTIGGEAQGEEAEKAYRMATPYMERALVKNYFEEVQYSRYVSSLANLYFTTGQKDEAEQTINKYLNGGQRQPTPEMVTFMAILMIDGNRWEEALVWVNTLLQTTLEPKVDYYMWAAACHQQLKNYEQAAAYVERVVQMSPTRADYWAQLVSMYYANSNPLGALNALERAQARGIMTSQRDYQTRAELYYNLEQYERAAVIMREGMLTGKIPNENRNWMLISYCYQTLKDKEKQLSSLIEASKQGNWPEIDYLIANLYWAQKDKPKETIKWIKSSLTKGNMSKPHELFILLISAAITVNDYNTATWALNKAKDYKEAATRIPQLEKYINSSKALYEEQRKEEKESKDS
ncbi:MAG: hypothetical protein SFY80_01155 [Verrucomicrobiota bacterium]|nr:hypothetical protein [Verrucomicrobiota bacterium]